RCLLLPPHQQRRALSCAHFFQLIRPPAPDPLFPYTTLFRSVPSAPLDAVTKLTACWLVRSTSLNDSVPEVFSTPTSRPCASSFTAPWTSSPEPTLMTASSFMPVIVTVTSLLTVLVPSNRKIVNVSTLV